MYTKKIFILFFCVFSKFETFSQLHWNRIISEPDSRILGFCINNLGEAFVSLYGNERVNKWNYVSPIDTFIRLPLVRPELFNANGDFIQLFMDHNNDLAVFFNGVVYKMRNGKFVLDSLKNSSLLPSGDPEYSKLDRHGNVQIMSTSSVGLDLEKWNDNTFITLLNLNGVETLDNFYPYDSNHNYAIALSLSSGGTVVYQYNSNRNYFEKLVESIYAPEPRSSYISYSGEIYLATSVGLLHYFRENNTYSLEMPIIEPNLGPRARVDKIYSSFDEKFLVAYLRPYFYFSYDKGKSWIKPDYFNQEFPSEINTLVDFYVFDSTSAILHGRDECYYDILYEIKPNQSWSKVNANTNNRYLRDLIKSGNKFLAAKDFDCNWIFSEDDGKNWKSLYPPDRTVFRMKNLVFNNKDYFFTWVNNVLYGSKNPNIKWDSLSKFNGNIFKIFTLSPSQIILVVNSIPGNPSSMNTFYYSNDKGNNWTLSSKQKSSDVSTGNMKYDSDSNIIAFNPYVFNSSVSISKDKGISWMKDNRFNYFTSILNITPYNDTSYYIVGQTKPASSNDNYSLYYTKDFINFKELTEEFKNYVLDVFVLSKNELLVAINIYPNNEGPLYYSSDNGENWTNISGNFSQVIPNERLSRITDVALDENKNFYISVPYDGLYKSSMPVFTKNVVDNNQFLAVSSSFQDILKFSVDESLKGQEVDIYTIDSKIVNRLRLNNLITDVHIHLTPGIYFAKIVGHNISIKFIIN